MSSTGYWAGYSRDGGVTCRVMDRGGQVVTTLEQIEETLRLLECEHARRAKEPT